MRFVLVPGTQTAFCIWETRVRDFRAFVESTGYAATNAVQSWTPQGWRQRGLAWNEPGFPQTDDHPAIGLNWHDARAFCQWLTMKEQRAGLLATNLAYRLPTNAEWDWAAGSAKYPWGDAWPAPNDAANLSGEEAQGIGTPVYGGHRDDYVHTAPVGSFKPNRLGLFDLAGNAWEWTDEGAPRAGENEITRGYGWLYDGTEAPQTSHHRTALRIGRYDSLGFRVVLGNAQAQ